MLRYHEGEDADLSNCLDRGAITQAEVSTRNDSVVDRGQMIGRGIAVRYARFRRFYNSILGISNDHGHLEDLSLVSRGSPK